MTAQQGPGQRLGHGLVYEEHTGRTVLFGGFSESGVPYGDTWAWDGASWRLLTVGGPPARKWPAMAYDEARDEIVLFGGLGGIGRAQPPFGDTWRWNGSQWREVHTTGPSPRDHVRMGWEHVGGRLILFGGFDGRSDVGDTWAWDGERWTRVGQGGPPPRAAHAMACDPTDGSILLFGGRSLERFFGDTWRWGGHSWARISADGPSPRAFHGMASLIPRQEALLFGGWTGPSPQRTHHGDTWAWSGVGWERVDIIGGPPALGIYTMAYDAACQGVIFHGGGRKAEGVTWHLEDRTWLHRDGQWTAQDVVS